MTEPPPRTEQERATTFDFLGGRYQGIGRYADAARAYRQAAEVAPSPRILLAWGMMETAAGHLAEARGAYERLLAKDSVTVTPWLGLATVATRSRDFAAGERAALRALAIDSTNATAIEILSYIEQQRRAPALPPGSRPRGR
jgi:tetratricopeptide (TPR) repeat protein